MPDPAHEVYVLCDCGDLEHCRMERYVSDVRIAIKEVDKAMTMVANVQRLNRLLESGVSVV